MQRLTYSLLALLVVAWGCSRKPPEHPPVFEEGGVIRIPVAKVNDGKVHFFTFKYEEKSINFFVRTDAKGKLRTHYDACYSCFKYKMGFRVVANEILCIACGLKYDLDKEDWDFIGPCSPIPLRSKVKRGDLVIRVSTIKRGKKLF